jgi:hypothetical protein
MDSSHGVSAGWYPDPSGMHQLRYYNLAWTDHVSDSGVVATSPLGQPASGSQSGPPVPPGGWAVVGQPTQFASGPAGPPPIGHPAVPAIKTRGPVVVLIAGLLMAVGPLFPWETASASTSFATTAADAKGTSEGAGPVVLIAGLVVALLAVLVFTGTIGRRTAGIAVLLLSLGSLVFAIGNYSAISKDVDSAPKGVDAAIGIGLFVAVIGCIMAAIASIGLIRNRGQS